MNREQRPGKKKGAVRTLFGIRLFHSNYSSCAEGMNELVTKKSLIWLYLVQCFEIKLIEAKDLPAELEFRQKA